jgi:GNAT superfamily N-acetyltransferase
LLLAGCRIIVVGSSLRIESVADRPELADVVAGWHFAEWGHLTPTLSLADRVQGVLAAADGTYVAVEGDEPVGTAGLVAHDMDTHPDLGPWLAGVYVTPDRRRRGVAAALTRFVAERAAAEGATTLYLYTDSAQSYWERAGWYRVGDEPYLGETVTVMGLRLSD